MSKLDVHDIICPMVERERDALRLAQQRLEQHVLWLRRRLRNADPSLPDEYDGKAWWELERPDTAPAEMRDYLAELAHALHIPTRAS